MDVHCPQCDTLYEFDERQMRGAIATLKCSVCQHLFRIETNISLGREDHRRWMARKTGSGDVMYFSGFDVLHRWIMEGQLGRQDEISRTGARWVRLEHIGEFTPVFEVVESIQSLTQPSNPDPLDDSRQRNRTIQQFATPQGQPLMRSPSRQPAPSWSGGQPAARQPEERGLSLPPSPHSSGLARAPSSADPAPSFSPSVRLPPQPQAPAPQPQRTHTPESLQAQVDPLAPTAAVDVPEALSSPPTTSEPQTVSPLAGPAETWTLHSEPEAEPELYRMDTTPPQTGGVNLVRLVIVLFVVCLIGVVGFRFAAPDKFESLFGGTEATPPDPVAKQVNEVAMAQADTPPSPEDAFETTRQVLDEALEAALQERDDLQGERMTEGIVAAMSPLHGAVTQAAERASKVKKGSSLKGMLKEAQSALDSGDSKRAYDLYYKVLDRDERNARALTGLGWTLIQMGRHESAAVQFKRAMSIDKGLVSAYLGLAKAERNKGNAKGAIRIYDEFLKRFPSSRQANIARTQRDKLLKEIGE